jgi:HPt (histidine-containing phosphotransfer) domain-containing protein
MEVFNSKFCLNQLNQNHELLGRLVTKFINDHQNSQSNLLDMLKNQQWDSAVLLIHTIKGISGNLGFEALFETTNALEVAAKQQTINEKQLEDLGDLIDLTIQEINHFMESEKAPNILSEQAPNTVSELDAKKADSLTSLINSLEKNQFIPNNKLASYILNLDLSQSEKDDLLVDIQHLNYEKALARLRKI